MFKFFQYNSPFSRYSARNLSIANVIRWTQIFQNIESLVSPRPKARTNTNLALCFSFQRFTKNINFTISVTTDLVPDPKFDFHHMSACHLLVMVVLLSVLLCKSSWIVHNQKQGKTWALGTSPPKNNDLNYLSQGYGAKSVVMEIAKSMFS